MFQVAKQVKHKVIKYKLLSSVKKSEPTIAGNVPDGLSVYDVYGFEMSNIQLNRIYIREFLFLLWLRIFNLIIMHCKFPYIPVKMYYLGAELLK